MRQTAKRSIPGLFLCIAMALPGLAQSQHPAPPTYVIQPNDVLTIFVWREPTLSGKVTVLPDGRVSLGLIQDMTAAGLNPGQLAHQISEHLKTYLIDAPPVVTVSVDTIQSYKVYVLGKVVKSGEYSAVQPLSIMQALALAGGMTDAAKIQEIKVFRGNSESSYRFNLEEFNSGKNSGQNILLKSGDIVYVP